MNIKQWIGKNFALKNIADTLDSLANHVTFGFVFACIAVAFKWIDGWQWSAVFFFFALYNYFKKYFPQILTVVAANQGVKDLNMPKE